MKKSGMKERTREIVILFLLSFVTPCILGLIFAALPVEEISSYWSKWFHISQIMYLWFCAGFTAGGILMLVTPLKGDHAIGFGCGLYYGTVFGANAIRKYFGYDGSDSFLYLTSFVITALICYIVWLKEIKRKYEKE